MDLLPRYRARLQPEWIDYNGHLRDAYYALVASLAIDDVMDHLGLDAAYRERTRCTLYTLELHMHYLHEVKSSDALEVQTTVLDCDGKRIHAGCAFLCGERTVAVCEIMLLHVRQGEKPASAPFPAEVESRLESLRLPPGAAQAWEPASRKIAIRRRPAA